jgi:NAD(P)-dependent dehydrogenase (short-subunit alcohol dehydrogenase family)
MALRHEPPETGDFYISKAGTFACAVYRRRGADAGAWVTPIGRVSVPDDVARIAAFLASDEASYITGESINLSGGLLMD